MLVRRAWVALAVSLFAAVAHADDALGAISELQREGLLHSTAPAAAPERHAALAQDKARRPTRERSARHRPASERRQRKSRDGAVSESYEQLKRSWHEPWAEPPEPDLPPSAPPLVLHPVAKSSLPCVLTPSSEHGGFDEQQVAAASQAFGSWPGGPSVSQRLLDLVYHAAQHFQVSHVHLVSGVRHDRGGSRHSHGLAADIVLPGVEDETLAHYFRAQGFVGVGVYTRSGFVHVDVRDHSFFWIDPSPPDRHLKIRPVRGEEARIADEAALARGQETFVNPPKLQKALHKRQKHRRAARQAHAD